MEYKIKARNHWWFDAGIVGLYFIGNRVKREKDYKDICLEINENNLTICGEDENQIKEFLQACYGTLASMYWNVSTESQKKRLELVIYDEEKREFSLAPKRNPTPVVGKFVKGSSWKAQHILYDEMDPILKTEVDRYLKREERVLWGGKKNKLLLSLPECQPRVKIMPKENKKRQLSCSVCGKLTSNLTDISQPSFFLFASKSAALSFHSQGQKPAKICWECEFISKFTMDTINYKKDMDDISILLLNSPNLLHNINNQHKIGSSSVLRSIDKDFFYKNIGFDEKGLISKARMPYELLWAYFVDTYSILKGNISVEVDEMDMFSKVLGEIVSIPLEIIVISLNEKGQTFITKDLIFFNDIDYSYRLISHLLEKGVNIKNVYHSLYETDNNNNLLVSRNKVLKNVLNKHCVLLDIEGIISRKVFNNKHINVSNMLKFLIEYYLIVKGDIMNREQINVAVNLGKQIVIQAYETGGRDGNALKKVRGDLFSLRKTRTITDFITQINTLQFRYGISVSNNILQGILNEVEFEDFKGYCIMGALNTYNNYSFRKKDKGEGKDA